MEVPFLRAVMGRPKPKAIKASPMKVPMILKNVGGAPKPLADHKKRIKLRPMKPNMEIKKRKKAGGRWFIFS